MSEGVCHCDHERFRHRGAKLLCGGKDWEWCRCPGYDDSVLPAPGERLEFGKHRQPALAAETAPAWPSLGDKG